MTRVDEPVIIGTRASGIAVAAALIALGHHPLMIDGGHRSEQAALDRQRSSLTQKLLPIALEGNEEQPG